MRLQFRLAFATLAILLSWAHAVVASDIIVLTTGGFKPALLDLTAAYEARTRETVVVANDTAGGAAARVARGEELDLVILPIIALKSLASQGRVVVDSVVPLAKSGIGVVVKQGMAPPDIGSVETFRQAMLAADSIAYLDPASGGSSGIYLAKQFDRLGIADAVRRKTILVPGGLAASRVSNGQAVLALQQISQLLAVKGVTYVGPLPPELQDYTVYAAGIPSSARRPAAGRALLAHLRDATAAKALSARGLEQP